VAGYSKQSTDKGVKGNYYKINNNSLQELILNKISISFKSMRVLCTDVSEVTEMLTKHIKVAPHWQTTKSDGQSVWRIICHV